MSPTVIKIENISKYYRLGLIGGATLREDMGRWVAKLRGKQDPLLIHDKRNYPVRKDGQIWALENINLQVKKGEILGIIGRNGAGKSTLLKILSRITAPTEGEIKINGRVASLLEVGTGFHKELTGRENIYLNGSILGMSRKEVTQKIDEIVDFSEMAQFIDTPVKRYSSGMTVRLAFAVAAHLEPEILIVDEVLAVGDDAFRKKCLGKMKDVVTHGRTILFVSHNISAIEDLCTRCIVLNGGKLVYDGNVDGAVNYYTGSETKKKARMKWGIGQDQLKSEAYITSVQAKTSTGDVCISGGDLRILIKYKKPHYVKKLEFGIGIYNTRDQKLFHMDTSFFRLCPKDNSNDGIIECKIDELPLPSGEYFLNVIAKSSSQMLDHIQNAIVLDVKERDFYRQKKKDSYNEPFFVKHTWDYIN